MLIVMKAHASEEQVRGVCQKIESLGLRPHSIPGSQRTAIGITGNEMELDPGTFDEMSGVQEVIRVSKPYKLVSRDVKEEDTIVRFPGTDASFGGDEVAVIAGPCAVLQLARRAHQASHRVAGVEQARHEPPADIARCSRDCDALHTVLQS